MRGPLAGIPGFRIKCGMTERVFPGYRVEYRVTPHPDAGSSKVPLVGIAFVGIPHPSISGYRVKARYDVEHRIKREMTETAGPSRMCKK